MLRVPHFPLNFARVLSLLISPEGRREKREERREKGKWPKTTEKVVVLGRFVVGRHTQEVPEKNYVCNFLGSDAAQMTQK